MFHQRWCFFDVMYLRITKKKSFVVVVSRVDLVKRRVISRCRRFDSSPRLLKTGWIKGGKKVQKFSTICPQFIHIFPTLQTINKKIISYITDVFVASVFGIHVEKFNNRPRRPSIQTTRRGNLPTTQDLYNVDTDCVKNKNQKDRDLE